MQDHILEQEVARYEAILGRVVRRLIADALAITGKPVRIHWDTSISTAATDCIANVRMSPRPFLEGNDDVGYGTNYHESGHIKHSPYGAALMEQAYREGGEVLKYLLNIVMDRKDDYAVARENPGFALPLRRRMLFIGTMALRKEFRRTVDAHTDEGETIRAVGEQLFRNFKPRDPYEDFFFAAKWHKTPRFKETKRAMRLISQKRLRTINQKDLLKVTKDIHEILGKSYEPEQRSAVEEDFMYLISAWLEAERGDAEIPPEIQIALQNILGHIVRRQRADGFDRLDRIIQSLSVRHATGLMSDGLVKSVPIRKASLGLSAHSRYQGIVAEIRAYITAARRAIDEISSPMEYTLYAQHDGDELDFNEVARMATGLPGYYKETVTDRDVDAEIHFAIDTSSSMSGEKLEQAKQLGVLFAEAIKNNSLVDGRLWSYDSLGILDHGEADSCVSISQIHTAGGNSDTHLLRHVGNELVKSPRKQRILILLCDEGPDSVKEVRRLTQQLLDRGVLVIHLYIGVHGSPDMFPVELLYTSMDECMQELGKLLSFVIERLK